MYVCLPADALADTLRYTGTSVPALYRRADPRPAARRQSLPVTVKLETCSAFKLIAPETNTIRIVIFAAFVVSAGSAAETARSSNFTGTSRPASSPTTRSAEASVSGRCAAMMRVMPMPFSAAFTRRSVPLSRALAPSSSTRMRGWRRTTLRQPSFSRLARQCRFHQASMCSLNSYCLRISDPN